MWPGCWRDGTCQLTVAARRSRSELARRCRWRPARRPSARRGGALRSLAQASRHDEHALSCTGSRSASKVPAQAAYGDARRFCRRCWRAPTSAACRWLLEGGLTASYEKFVPTSISLGQWRAAKGHFVTMAVAMEAHQVEPGGIFGLRPPCNFETAFIANIADLIRSSNGGRKAPGSPPRFSTRYGSRWLNMKRRSTAGRRGDPQFIDSARPLYADTNYWSACVPFEAQYRRCVDDVKNWLGWRGLRRPNPGMRATHGRSGPW